MSEPLRAAAEHLVTYTPLEIRAPDAPYHVIAYRVNADAFEALRAALGAPAVAPSGPWRVESRGDVPLKGGRVYYVVCDAPKRQQFYTPTEAEAIAVRDALNRVASEPQPGEHS